MAFLDAVLVGCLLSCFRARPRRGSGSGPRDSLVHGERDAEVLRDDERGMGRSGRSEQDFADGAGIEEEQQLRQEANYLKLCGTISTMPAELQNESYESNLESSDEWDNKPNNGPATKCTLPFAPYPSEQCEEHHISVLNTEYTRRPHGGEAPHSIFLEKSPLQSAQHKLLDHSGSPFPTPLVLRDDMQTPGTVYTSHRGASISGKHVRTRKQFIYPVLRPIENRLQQMELTEDSSPLPSSNPPKRRALEADSIKKLTQTSSTSVVKSGLSETPSSFAAPDDNTSQQVKEELSPVGLFDGGEGSKSNMDEKNAAFSLSHWLKSSSTDVENQGDVKCPADNRTYGNGIFLTEGPLLIASEMKFDVENPTPRLPKAWDGNGIPNTTTRYKEDQKVSWHTTPFEERLLRVLSDEERCPPRKVVRAKLFHPEEKTE